jgi:hypothetical protein
MSRTRRGSTSAGVGAIAFGVLTVVGTLGGAPGGKYDEPTVAQYVSIGHFPIVVITGYLALLGVVGLICALAYLHELINATDKLTAGIFWGVGLASAVSFAVAWGLVTGVALAPAEGGSGAAIAHPVTYVLSDAGLNVLFGSGGVLLGVALITLMLGTRNLLPSWLQWVTLVAGVLAIGAPFFFPALAIPLWAVIFGIWLLAGSAARPAGTATPNL